MTELSKTESKNVTIIDAIADYLVWRDEGDTEQTAVGVMNIVETYLCSADIQAKAAKQFANTVEGLDVGDHIEMMAAWMRDAIDAAITQGISKVTKVGLHVTVNEDDKTALVEYLDPDTEKTVTVFGKTVDEALKNARYRLGQDYGFGDMWVTGG